VVAKRQRPLKHTPGGKQTQRLRTALGVGSIVYRSQGSTFGRAVPWAFNYMCFDDIKIQQTKLSKKNATCSTCPLNG
jgi:hypothetical protein